ncbi:MAG: hypothetical protein JXA54_01135, partial [Candidatus Heimdallarchaeota archaeon]|nr:hypothetical protein [Candidatus Heimdallarchaeota archaeon]
PTDEETIIISCEVTDASGIQSVTLYYRINEGSWTSVSMVLVDGSTYGITIGTFSYNDFIEYYIIAIDNSPNHNIITDNNNGLYYSFVITAGSTTSTSSTNIAYFIPILALFGIASISLFRKKQ